MLNKVILIGRVGRDPEIRYTTAGQAVASFSLATSETWKDKDGSKKDKTEWHNCVAWGKLGEIAGEYVKKGTLLYCEGKIESREYEGKDGVKRKQYNIVLSILKMLGGGKSNGQSQAKPTPQEEEFTHEEEDDIKM